MVCQNQVFRQIVYYLAELFRQIAFPEKGAFWQRFTEDGLHMAKANTALDIFLIAAFFFDNLGFLKLKNFFFS